MYDVGYFKLPDAVGIKTNEEWISIPRISRTIPFGYEVSPDNPDILLPIIEELEALDLAKKYLTEYSYRDVARWLSDKTKRNISHAGLRKRVKIERSRSSKAKAYKNWLTQYEKALHQLEKIEGKYTGAKESTDPNAEKRREQDRETYI
jgi:hypothetical protein